MNIFKYLIFFMLLTGIEAVYPAQRDKEILPAEQEQSIDISQSKKLTESISIFGDDVDVDVDISGFGEPSSEAIFVSEYTRISPPENGGTNQNGIDFNEFVDAETKSDIKAFIKEIKDPIKLKALEYGLISVDELKGLNSFDEQLISGFEEKNNLSKEYMSVNPTPGYQWERERQQQGVINNSYDEEATEEFYKEVKTVAIVLVTLYLLYQSFLLLFRRKQ